MVVSSEDRSAKGRDAKIPKIYSVKNEKSKISTAWRLPHPEAIFGKFILLLYRAVEKISMSFSLPTLNLNVHELFVGQENGKSSKLRKYFLY